MQRGNMSKVGHNYGPLLPTWTDLVDQIDLARSADPSEHRSHEGERSHAIPEAQGSQAVQGIRLIPRSMRVRFTELAEAFLTDDRINETQSLERGERHIRHLSNIFAGD